MGISMLLPAATLLTADPPADTAAAAAVGTGLLAARSDHVHRAVGSSTPALVGSAAAAAGAAALAARADHVHTLDDTGWIAPTMTNGWVHYGAPYTTPGYRRIGPVVLLKGLLKSGTISTPAFTVPVGFRTTQDRHYATLSLSALGGVRVFTDGRVTPGDPGSNSWISLDGVIWTVD